MDGMANGYRQRGLAVVETTVVLPLLLLLLLAIGEFGRMLYQYNTLTRAVRAGSQIEMESDNIFDVVAKQEREQRIKNLILYGTTANTGIKQLSGLEENDISIVYFESPSGSGDYYYAIEVLYNWTPIFGDNFNTFFGNTLSLSFPLRTSMTVRELNQ